MNHRMNSMAGMKNVLETRWQKFRTRFNVFVVSDREFIHGRMGCVSSNEFDGWYEKRVETRWQKSRTRFNVFPVSDREFIHGHIRGRSVIE